MFKFNDLKSKLSHEKINRFFTICNKSCTKMSDYFNRGVQKLAKFTAKRGISANMITLSGFVIGLLAINFLALEYYGYALICILINRFCDILDGAVAKLNKITKFGLFFDATVDYMFYAGVIFGFALANPDQNAVAASFLLFAFASSACALLAYAIVAQQNESTITEHLNKSPFYLGGLAQGFETFATLVILCVIPRLFMPLAIILGIFCLIKAISVIISSYYVLVIAEKKSAKGQK